jgi:hypothetical protein
VTLPEAVQAICARFLSGWSDAGRTEPIKLEGESANMAGESFVRLTIRELTTDQRTLGQTGDRKFRRPGLILVQCFAALDPTRGRGGRAAADALGEVVKDIFEAAQFGGVSTYESTSRTLGIDGQYLGKIVETRFDFVETR